MSGRPRAMETVVLRDQRSPLARVSTWWKVNARYEFWVSANRKVDAVRVGSSRSITLHLSVKEFHRLFKSKESP